MSAVPDLAAPTLVGPYKTVAPPPVFNFPTPVSNADLYRQRKNEQIDAKRRAGTQALQTIKGNVPIGGFPIPATGAPKPSILLGKAPPPATAAPQAATPDAYLQSQQNLIGAENKLLGLMGQAQPQYKPPNKGLEYLAAGISLLFPGAPIAHAAGGLLQGMQAGADQRYQRDQQAQQQEIGNAERQTQVFGTIADAQARVQAQVEATRERQQEYAQRNAMAREALNEKRSEFQQMLPIHSAAAQSLINYRIGELSNAAARNTITQQDAQLRAQTVVQIAAFREASMNGRHAGDLGMRSAANQLGLLEKQTDNQIRALDASVAADPTQAATAQASAAQLIANEQNQAQKIIGNVSSGKPDILKIEDFAVQLPLPAAQPQQGTQSQGGYQIPASPWGTGTQQHPVIPNQQQVESDQHATADPFPGHPGVGKGTGVDPKVVSGYEQLLSQHGGKFQSEDQVLHEIAQTESLKGASADQIRALVGAWQKAHKPVAQQPSSATPTPGPTPHPIPSGGSHVKNPFEQVGFANPQAREDIGLTHQRLQYGLGYVLGPLSPEVTSVSHGTHAENSAHYSGRAVDVGAFGGTSVGENTVTWDAVMRGIASGVFSKIGTIYAIWSNPTAQAFAHSHGVELFHDEGSGPHVHFETPQ